MPTTAKEFQVVLRTIKNWYLLFFRDFLVNGQLALEDASYDVIPYVNANYDVIPYVVQYCSKRELFRGMWYPRTTNTRQHKQRKNDDWGGEPAFSTTC